VDTRSKILTGSSVNASQCPRPLAVVSGIFDVLRTTHARELTQIRDRVQSLLVVVLPASAELLPQRSRAELVAALRVVDYVVIADHTELDRLIESVKPEEFVRLEAADAIRTRQLIEHVHRRQS